ncbi:MAG: GNAT family N-acetyltransferase [Muribaculaceae bacterium]|nr:GNAT family N-acetyltransferase [Muribaculaceae bacterium]
MTLEHIDFDTLFQSFEKAFADYEIHFEKDEVRSMLNRRGYNPRLSFAAFVNDEIVAFTLNGTGTFNGIPTAYDTGTGTLKKYRGNSIARKIFTHSIPFLKPIPVGSSAKQQQSDCRLSPDEF